ncbi:prepilin peptidase [Propioniciclava coleopterorum]|uniref:Prepilin peptidase n=1 Tax=Propioniciclava coleopterorum TaxID=2714937 RepID=A0A6G7Y8G6_9ACTN|nr:prepilin peptidase [Propioniciclava coleopterorum]QIK72921.1 prepilin peptidase [Propioniciclava coleopterorum]
MPAPGIPLALPPLLVVACCLLAGLAAGALTRPVLARLPEPPDGPAAHKPPYAALGTHGFAVSVGALAALATAVAWLSTPPALWLAWASLSTVNVLACAIDARTTWLPRRLSLVGGAVAAAGAVVAGVAQGSWTPPIAAVLGALGVGAFFHLAWRLTGALGYGDVRLAATIGAVTACTSPPLALTALLAGTVAGALTGVLVRLSGRTGGFAYGPGLLAGAFAALLLPGG